MTSTPTPSLMGTNSKYKKITQNVPEMDKYQREVMRRKRPIIADVLDFSPASQKYYKEVGILRDDLLPEIMTEQTDFGRTFKWLELLGRGPAVCFDRLADLLIEKKYSWLADELYADLLAERGDLEVEEYVYRECGMICHKYFGRSKRVSETDKKEIQTILSMRYQSAKEAWRRQLEKSERSKDEAVAARNRDNGRMRALAEKIHSYMRVEKDRVSKYGHDMITAIDQTIENLDPENEKQDYFQMADRAVDNTLILISSILFQKELRDGERLRCMNILNINKPNVELDIVLESALQRAAEDIVKSKQEADMSDKLASTLDTRLKMMKRDTDMLIHEKEKQVLQLEQVIRNRDARIKQLEDMLGDHKQEIYDLEDEVEKWKRRCGMIEKTRRLGYYYPGWSDKMNADIDTIEYTRKEKQNWFKPSNSTTPPMSSRPRTPRRILIRKTQGSASTQRSQSARSVSDKGINKPLAIEYVSAKNTE